MSKQNRVILIIAIIFAVAVGLIYWLSGQNNNGGDIKALQPINSADHLKGDIKAPVKMIVYSDFECPFCEQFAGEMKKVEDYFKNQVVIAFRHYPLAIHQQAQLAAEASECAAEQDKFWQMHDKLFADNAAGRLGAEQFKQDAADLGLDTAKFNACLDSQKYKDQVIEETAAGKKAGVTGTPTTFINGNIYPGAYPFDDFTAPNGDKEAGLKTIISKLLK